MHVLYIYIYIIRSIKGLCDNLILVLINMFARTKICGHHPLLINMYFILCSVIIHKPPKHFVVEKSS